MGPLAFLWCGPHEADIVGHTLRHLLREGIAVHVFDNWTDKKTRVVLRSIQDQGPGFIPNRQPYPMSRVRIERWPRWHKPRVISWRAMLEHTARTALWTAQAHGPFWAIHHDADEIRRSQVPGEPLVEFYARVGKSGWNAVDHRCEVYAARDGYDPTVHDPETYFTDRVEEHIDMHNGQIKSWLQQPDVLVDLATYGGHSVRFPDRRVCPERLILRHFPWRGAKQRAAKQRRQERWDPKEKARGWHLGAPQQVSR